MFSFCHEVFFLMVTLFFVFAVFEPFFTCLLSDCMMALLLVVNTGVFWVALWWLYACCCHSSALFLSRFDWFVEFLTIFGGSLTGFDVVKVFCLCFQKMLTMGGFGLDFCVHMCLETEA